MSHASRCYGRSRSSALPSMHTRPRARVGTRTFKFAAPAHIRQLAMSGFLNPLCSLKVSPPDVARFSMLWAEQKLRAPFHAQETAGKGRNANFQVRRPCPYKTTSYVGLLKSPLFSKSPPSRCRTLQHAMGGAEAPRSLPCTRDRGQGIATISVTSHQGFG
jgi:hypothetical protein